MSRYAKGIVAVLIAGLTVLASAITDNVITPSEWVNIALACVGAVGVYAVPNKRPEDEPYDPAISEGEAEGF